MRTESMDIIPLVIAHIFVELSCCAHKQVSDIVANQQQEMPDDPGVRRTVCQSIISLQVEYPTMLECKGKQRKVNDLHSLDSPRKVGV